MYDWYNDCAAPFSDPARPDKFDIRYPISVLAFDDACDACDSIRFNALPTVLI